MQLFPRSPWRIGLIMAAVAGTVALVARFGISLRWFVWISPLMLMALLGVVIVAAGVGSDRRRKRFLLEKEGRCVSCGYDRRGLGADAQCPECGASADPK